MSGNVEAALNMGFFGMVYRGGVTELEQALRNAGIIL
jgi:hypothetical protein